MACKTADTKKGKNQHVTPHPDGGWQVKGEGNSKATIRTKTKEEAVQKAKEIAKNQNAEYVPHKKDGKLQKKNY